MQGYILGNQQQWVGGAEEKHGWTPSCAPTASAPSHQPRAAPLWQYCEKHHKSHAGPGRQGLCWRLSQKPRGKFPSQAALALENILHSFRLVNSWCGDFRILRQQSLIFKQTQKPPWRTHCLPLWILPDTSFTAFSTTENSICILAVAHDKLRPFWVSFLFFQALLITLLAKDTKTWNTSLVSRIQISKIKHA